MFAGALAAVVATSTGESHPDENQAPTHPKQHCRSHPISSSMTEGSTSRPDHRSRGIDESMATRIGKQETLSIGGQVASPGPIHWHQGITLLESIETARGVTEFGSLRRVKVFRSGKQYQYDLTKPEGQNILLEANDTIEVPQKKIWMQ